MALPTKDLTWRSKLNTMVAAQGSILNTQRQFLRTMKDGMISSSGYDVAPSAQFTTRYSCDSVTAGTAGDGVDRWDANSDIVFANAGSAHSWYVFRNTAIAANYELCLALQNTSANGTNATWILSPSAGFTGGTTTARPTATDEITPAPWTNFAFGGGADTQRKLHQQFSSTGSQFRHFEFMGGNLHSCLIIGVPKNPVTGWTNPSITMIASGNTVADVSSIATVANGPFRARGNALTLSVTGTVMGWGTSTFAANAVLTVRSAFTNEYPMLAVGLACAVSGAEDPKLGELYDAWWGLSNLAHGTGYPGDASRQFIQVGDLIVPNNGTIWDLS